MRFFKFFTLFLNYNSLLLGMKYILPIFLISLNCSFSQELTKIAFGSCAHQGDSLFILNDVVKHKPDYFVFLGDNIYADTYNVDTLKSYYEKLKAKTAYQNLKRNTKIIATWDDHDYGMNDIGKYYDCKKESKEIFLDFFEEPLISARRFHEGIYTSYRSEVKLGGNITKKIQFIVLDERTFRSNLSQYDFEIDTLIFKDKRYFYDLDYVPQISTDSTILGKDQWIWLENELKKEADIRIICSGTQFGIEYNGYESWANFPAEKEKMVDLILKTKAKGVIFISGDVHYSEISKNESAGMYPIYDITSSGLSETWKFATPNKNRIEGPIMDNNFGLLTLDWKKLDIKMEIWDKKGNQRIEYTIPFSDLDFE